MSREPQTIRTGQSIEPSSRGMSFVMASSVASQPGAPAKSRTASAASSGSARHGRLMAPPSTSVRPSAVRVSLSA